MPIKIVQYVPEFNLKIVNRMLKMREIEVRRQKREDIGFVWVVYLLKIFLSVDKALVFGAGKLISYI